MPATVPAGSLGAGGATSKFHLRVSPQLPSRARGWAFRPRGPHSLRGTAGHRSGGLEATSDEMLLSNECAWPSPSKTSFMFNGNWNFM